MIGLSKLSNVRWADVQVLYPTGAFLLLFVSSVIPDSSIYDEHIELFDFVQAVIPELKVTHPALYRDSLLQLFL